MATALDDGIEKLRGHPFKDGIDKLIECWRRDVVHRKGFKNLGEVKVMFSNKAREQIKVTGSTVQECGCEYAFFYRREIKK